MKYMVMVAVLVALMMMVCPMTFAAADKSAPALPTPVVEVKAPALPTEVGVAIDKAFPKAKVESFTLNPDKSYTVQIMTADGKKSTIQATIGDKGVTINTMKPTTTASATSTATAIPATTGKESAGNDATKMVTASPATKPAAAPVPLKQ